MENRKHEAICTELHNGFKKIKEDMKLKKCSKCFGNLNKVIIENHGKGGFFKALECEDCLERQDIKKLTDEELYDYMCPCCGQTTNDGYVRGEPCQCGEDEAEEKKSYEKDGYIEVNCPSCNTEQWMLGTKKEGVCCECGEGFDNECADDCMKDKLKELTTQKNNLNRKISALKKATLN